MIIRRQEALHICLDLAAELRDVLVNDAQTSRDGHQSDCLAALTAGADKYPVFSLQVQKMDWAGMAFRKLWVVSSSLPHT